MRIHWHLGPHRAFLSWGHSMVLLDNTLDLKFKTWASSSYKLSGLSKLMNFKFQFFVLEIDVSILTLREVVKVKLHKTYGIIGGTEGIQKMSAPSD